METLIGRESEKNLLEKVKLSNKPEFVAIYGRRRIGKTFLIRSVFENNFTFYLTGIANVNTAQQLANFASSYNATIIGSSENIPQNWFDAFGLLRKLIDSKPKDDLKIIFLDELPWLDTPRSNFIMALEHFWNSYGSMDDKLKLIVCGSAASWIINKLINNHGGLHNRVTKRVHLQPFTLKETELYFHSNHIFLDRYQIIQLYSVMGGVPFYLNEIEDGLSAFQNIDKICFSPTGLLFTEYQNLFKSLFKDAEIHQIIISIIAQKAKGLTRDEIITLGKLPNGGTTTKVLEELEVSGFIKKYFPFGKKIRNSLYQLVDPFSLFYHHFMKDAKIQGEGAWMNLMETPAYRAWSGNAFEYVCMAHLPAIKKALGISGVYTESSAWRSQNREENVQIDLLIDRKDNTINLCEMKFSTDEYEITKDYAQQLRKKISVFKSETKTRKSVFLTMITTFGVKVNINSLGLVQNNITVDALFEF